MASNSMSQCILINRKRNMNKYIEVSRRNKILRKSQAKRNVFEGQKNEIMKKIIYKLFIEKSCHRNDGENILERSGTRSALLAEVIDMKAEIDKLQKAENTA